MRLYVSKYLGAGFRIGTGFNLFGGGGGPTYRKGNDGCFKFIIYLVLIALAVALIIKLLPAIIGFCVIYVITYLASQIAKKYPTQASQIWIAAIAIDTLVVIGVVTFYINDAQHQQEQARIARAQASTNQYQQAKPAMPYSVPPKIRTVIGAMNVSFNDPTPIQLGIQPGNQYILQNETLLEIAPSNSIPPSFSTDLKRLAPGTIALIETTENFPNWLFARTYKVYDKMGWTTVWEEIGSGWLKSTTCSSTARLFTPTRNEMFSPVQPDHFISILREALAYSSTHFPIRDRGDIANQRQYMNSIRSQFINKVISWPNAHITGIAKDFLSDSSELVCTVRCSDKELRFPVSASMATYLKSINGNIYRIEGLVKSLDIDYEKLELQNVIITFDMNITDPK